MFKQYGAVAVNKANSIPELHVDRKGKIQSLGAHREQILHQLVQQYQDLVGDVARFVVEDDLRKLLHLAAVRAPAAPAPIAQKMERAFTEKPTRKTND